MNETNETPKEFEARLRETATADKDPDEFTHALSFDDDARCRDEIGVPCSFWGRVRAEVHPLACRVRWVEAPSWKSTADSAPAVGLAFTVHEGVSGRVRPTPSVPSLICERHKARMPRLPWRFIPLPPRGGRLEIDAVFQHEVHRAIIHAICANEGRMPFEALRTAESHRGDPYFIGGGLPVDPRWFGWQVRHLADAGWLLARVVPVGSGDATIEGDVVLSPAFVQLFEGLGPYWTVKIPFESDPEKRTPWHPTEPTGAFKVRTSGAFPTEAEAAAWCREKLGDTVYTIEHVPLPEL